MLEDLQMLVVIAETIQGQLQHGQEPMPLLVSQLTELADKIGRQADPKLDTWTERAAIYGINPNFPSG